VFRAIIKKLCHQEEQQHSR